MADVPVGAVPAPETPAAPAAAARRPDPGAARAAKLASVSAGLTKLEGLTPAPGAAVTPAPTGPEPVVKPAIAGLGEPPAAKPAPADPAITAPEPAAAKPDDKAAITKPDAKVEPVDDKTAKAIAAIDRRAAEFRKEQAAATAKLELDRAELARLRSDVDGRGASLKEMQELAKRDPIGALAKLGIESEDDWETVGRGAYPRTKAGKADPRALPAVAQTAKERELANQIAELKAQNAEIVEHIRTQSATQASTKFVNEYLDGAVKAIPTTPSLIGKLHAKSPEKARSTLLALGKTMEREAMAAEGAKKYDPSHTPSHPELVARYEKDRRAELEEQGVDVDALLAIAKPAPVAAAAPTARAGATIDPTATRGTRPHNENPTREQRLASVSAGLKKLDAAQS